MNSKNKKETGFVLAGAFLIIVVALILIPSFILLTNHESKSTAKESKSTTAFHLAESGQDRGIWKLRESAAIWDAAVAGSSVTGYDFDVIYEGEHQEGQYQIQFVSGPDSDQVTVISKGKAYGSDQVRAIEAIYGPGGTALGALSVSGGIDYKPNLNVHWGPVVTYTSIDLDPGETYPRKYSEGQIVGRDTVNDSNNGALPSGDWATYDYAAFQDLGTPPSINLAELEDAARNSCVPILKRVANQPATHTSDFGCDSGYYEDDVTIIEYLGGPPGNYSLECSTCVIYIVGDIKSFPINAWMNVRALVATGDVDFNARSSTFTADIPDLASDQYLTTDGLAKWAAEGWTDGGTANLTDVGMHGFLYVGIDLTNSGGGSKIVGSIFVGEDVTVNTMDVYYDEDVLVNIPVNSDGTISRVKWDEIVTDW